MARQRRIGEDLSRGRDSMNARWTDKGAGLSCRDESGDCDLKEKRRKNNGE